MHGFDCELDPIWVVLPNDPTCQQIVIPYRLHAANLPTPASGQVTVRIEWSEVEPWSAPDEEDADDTAEEEDQED